MKHALLFLSPLTIIFSLHTLFAGFNGAPNSIDNTACPAPIITGFSPSTGPINTEITVIGSNFSDTNTANFNGTNATFTVISDNEIRVLVPNGVANTATISLISSGGCSGNSSNSFDLIDDDCDSSVSDEIYISEIYDSDGGSYGIIELYNPTSNTVVLDGVYHIDRYGDIGNPTPSYTIPLSGSINPMDTFIIKLGSGGNTCNGLTSDLDLGAGINGNDEIILVKNGVSIDVIHTDVNIGYTYIRNPDAEAPSIIFDIADWMFSNIENCSDLGMHTQDQTNAPNITHPVSQSICIGEMVTFTVAVDMGSFTYQWKVLDASGNWINVTNDANYSGAMSNTLTISNTLGNFNGNQYYCEMSSTNCNLTTYAVQLQVLDPSVDTLGDQTECDSFVLPNLSNGSYFTGTNGSGTQLNAGDAITSSQTIYIYNEIGTAPDTCSNQSSFEVTITGTPEVDNLGDQTECDSFVLPNLNNGSYFTGTNGSGTQLNPGDTITSSQTIYIYSEVGTAPDTCSNQSSFEVTITGTPEVDTLGDQTECDSFVLPNLSNGSYFTGTNGSGTQLNPGDTITSSQTIYIYSEIGTAPDTCSNQSSFEVTITGTPEVDTLGDQTECDSFVLPNLSNGSYFTGTNGSGTQLNPGDTITSSQTIYIFSEIGTAPNTCSNQSSFEVTITGTPEVDNLGDQTECDSFVLPNLSNGSYFTGTNGSGTQLNAGDTITSSQTIYIYSEIGTAPDTCSNQSSFEVTITGTPEVDTLGDQTECDSFVLPNLNNGSYFTGTNGSGTQLNAGDTITSSQTIYIYSEVGTAPNTCSNQSSFEVTINISTDFTLTEDNLLIFEDNLTVNMFDLSIDYEYAVDSTNFQASNVFYNLTEGAHTVFVKDGNGCIIKSLAFEIEVTLFIPLYFTPNDDGYHDHWKVIDSQNQIKEIFIFDRFGKLLKQLAPNSNGWNGVYNGNILESNDYWYLITLRDNRQLRGHFTLKH